MTIEQAKSELMQIYGALSPSKQQAIDTLVKIEPCEDAISRQAVLGIVRDMKGLARAYVLPEAINQVKSLPPVNPQEPKTGHWKRISIDKYSEHAKYWYRCDRCGKDNLGNTDWCPNCGCRMVEPQESEK